MIRANDIVFGYNKEDIVLKGISLAIEEGDMTGILGPNGSGKSTLLGILCGTLDPWRGTTTLKGKNIRYLNRKEIARIIAVVPQKSDLGFDYRVEEVVSMGRYPHLGRFSFHDPRGNGIVEEAMELTEVLDLREKTVDRLSGGERQRVMIARALAQEPRILVLDEPTKNLDIRHSMDIMELIRRRNRKQDLTVISVLHDLDLAARYCDDIILLKKGRIAASGKVGDVLSSSIIENVFDIKVRVHGKNGFHIEVKG